MQLSEEKKSNSKQVAAAKHILMSVSKLNI